MDAAFTPNATTHRAGAIPVPPAAPGTPVPVVELETVDAPSPVDAETVAVEAIQWTVAAGERWLIVGPPGSGKSTVLGVAAGLVRPLRGRHRLFGMDLSRLTEEEQLSVRRRVGVVFGGGGRLFDHMTVAENLALPTRYNEDAIPRPAARRMADLLEAFDLAPYAHRRPRQLPRRIAQRAALARALALEPEVLLLDDPLSGLSPDESDWWLSTLQRGSAAWVPSTWIIACTDPRPWSRALDHVAVVEDGTWRLMDAPPRSASTRHRDPDAM